MREGPSVQCVFDAVPHVRQVPPDVFRRLPCVVAEPERGKLPKKIR